MWLMAVGVGELGWGQRGGGRENTERKRGEVLGGGGCVVGRGVDGETAASLQNLGPVDMH